MVLVSDKVVAAFEGVQKAQMKLFDKVTDPERNGSALSAEIALASDNAVTAVSRIASLARSYFHLNEIVEGQLFDYVV